MPYPSLHHPPRQPGYGYHKRFYKRHHSPHQPSGRDERCTERTLPTLPHYGRGPLQLRSSPTGYYSHHLRRNQRKFHADLRESYRREREQEKERYRNEIIGYHGSEEGLETLLGYQLFSIGNRADSAALAYQVDYVLDGYVKKAGTNFVLSVGRLIGSQPELKGEQRLRKEDIYWEMPRCYQWDITVNLPEGYRISPEGLERLNVKVENDCGAFIVQATTEDGTLRIKAEKRINHKTEPVANWEKLLEITDAANSYEALSIVFQATINPPTSPTTGY